MVVILQATYSKMKWIICILNAISLKFVLGQITIRQHYPLSRSSLWICLGQIMARCQEASKPFTRNIDEFNALDLTKLKENQSCDYLFSDLRYVKMGNFIVNPGDYAFIFGHGCVVCSWIEVGWWWWWGWLCAIPFCYMAIVHVALEPWLVLGPMPVPFHAVKVSADRKHVDEL